jgi:2-methylcitrate dehydratase PrpD
MVLREDKTYSRDYLDPAKRTNSNSIRVHLKDGTSLPLSEVLYPLGHRRRRKEAIPVLMKKFETNVARVFAGRQREAILRACLDQKRLETMPVDEFMDLVSM